jgi:hypothetical protein
VAAGVHKKNRIIWSGFAEFCVQGQSLNGRDGGDAPLGLVPSTSQDPLSGFRFRGRFCGKADDIFPGFRSCKVNLLQRAADAGEMGVTVDETRDNDPVIQGEYLGTA